VVFTAAKIHVDVFLVVTLYSAAIGYQHIGDGGSKVLRIVGVPPQDYIVSLPRRPQRERQILF